MALHLREMSTLLEQKILKSYSKLNINDIILQQGVVCATGLQKHHGCIFF